MSSSSFEGDENRGYTEKRVRAIKLMANRAGALVWMHNNSYMYYRRANKIFIIVSASLSYLFGTSGITTLVVTDNKIFSYIVQSFVVLVGLLITIHGALKIDEKAERQKWSSDQNTELHLSTRRELDKPILERTKADKFIHKCLKHEFRIRSDSPHIPKSIVKKYYTNFAERALPHEVIFHFDDGDLLYLDETDQPSTKMHWNESVNETVNATPCDASHGDVVTSSGASHGGRLVADMILPDYAIDAAIGEAQDVSSSDLEELILGADRGMPPRTISRKQSIADDMIAINLSSSDPEDGSSLSDGSSGSYITSPMERLAQENPPARSVEPQPDVRIELGRVHFEESEELSSESPSRYSRLRNTVKNMISPRNRPPSPLQPLRKASDMVNKLTVSEPDYDANVEPSSQSVSSNKKRARIRDSVIDRMAALEALCNRETPVNIKKILDDHEKLTKVDDTGETPRRVRYRHPARKASTVEKFELEKYKQHK